MKVSPKLVMMNNESVKEKTSALLDKMANRNVVPTDSTVRPTSRKIVRVLGIDQSFTGTGLSFLEVALNSEENDTILISGTTNTFSTPTNIPLLRRMQLIRDAVSTAIKTMKPDVVAIECAILEGEWVAGLNGLYFMLMDYLQFSGINVIVFQPLQHKSLIERKRGLTKQEIQAKAKEFFELGVAINNNEADSLFLAWNGARFTFYKRGFDLGRTESENYVFFSKAKSSSKVGKDEDGKSLMKGMLHRPWESYFEFSNKQLWLRGESHATRTKVIQESRSQESGSQQASGSREPRIPRKRAK